MSQPTPARQIRPIRSCLGTSPTAMRDNIRDRAGTMGRFSQARHRPRTPHRPPASRTVRPPPPAPTGPISDVDPADAASGVGGAVGRERGHQAVGGGDHAIAGPCRYALSSVVGLHRTMPGSPPSRSGSSCIVESRPAGGDWWTSTPAPHPSRFRCKPRCGGEKHRVTPSPAIRPSPSAPLDMLATNGTVGIGH